MFEMKCLRKVMGVGIRVKDIREGKIRKEEEVDRNNMANCRKGYSPNG